MACRRIERRVRTEEKASWAASLASVPAGTWTESEKAWWGAKEEEEKKTGLVQTEAPFEPPPVEVEDAPAVAIVKDDDSVTVTDEEIAAVMRGGLKFLSWSETLPERRARATAVRWCRWQGPSMG